MCRARTARYQAFANTLGARGERAETLVGFALHLINYLAVSVLLLLINLFASPSMPWAIWPLLGWGIGVASHGAGVFFGGGDGRPALPMQKPVSQAIASSSSDWSRVER
ncbi:MAG: 2TM domain-containing protein, partial [Rhodothermales bacterium]